MVLDELCSLGAFGGGRSKFAFQNPIHAMLNLRHQKGGKNSVDRTFNSANILDNKIPFERKEESGL
jgi:hypothetical protein